MPNATVRADAQAMPIDRRAALGSLAGAVGAFLAAPGIAGAAAHPDADLFALVLRARALDSEAQAASKAYAEAEGRMNLPSIPAALIARESDRALFRRLTSRVGSRFSSADIADIRAMRAAAADMIDLVVWRDAEHRAQALAWLTRAAEIEEAQGEYEARRFAAREAADLPALEAEVDRLHGELRRAWRAIAFTPARTREGVLAKLEAVAGALADPLDPEDFPETCDAETVVCQAAADLAAILANVEA